MGCEPIVNPFGEAQNWPLAQGASRETIAHEVEGLCAGRRAREKFSRRSREMDGFLARVTKRPVGKLLVGDRFELASAVFRCEPCDEPPAPIAIAIVENTSASLHRLGYAPALGELVGPGGR